MNVRNIWGQNVFPELFDYSVMFAYLVIIFIIGLYIQKKNIESNESYRFFLPALTAKIFGAIALCLVYSLYYGVADSLGFYISSEAMVNLLLEDPVMYFRLLFGDRSDIALTSFTPSTGYPWYRHDASSFFIVRVASVFTFFGFKNYFTASILYAVFFFIGYWKLFLLFTRIYPKYQREFFWGVFLFPSVMFWGSGILKDTLTLSMTGWFLAALYDLFVLRRKKFASFMAILVTGYLIMSIKAYIIVALIPGALIWIGWSYIRKIENMVVRFVAAPVTIMAFLGLGLILLNALSGFLGEYGSIESIINKSIVTYKDHTTTAHYGTNYYTLGEFDGTLPNFLSKAPLAITAGLFRPFLWEINNPFMLLAALENLTLMIVVLIIFWRTGIVKTIKIAFDEPLVIFSLSFAIVFAFAVGVSTANFGALVRLKIPMLPFLAVALVTLYKRSQEIRDEKRNNEASFLGTISTTSI